MKIEFGNLLLCEGPVRGLGRRSGPVAGSLSLNGRRISQEAQFLSAAAVTMFDRGNLKTSLAFQVRIEHATTEDAEYYMLTHYLTITGRATATFTAQSASGSVAKTYLANAVLSETDHSVNGVGSYHTYQISGGAMTTTPPAS